MQGAVSVGEDVTEFHGQTPMKGAHAKWERLAAVYGQVLTGKTTVRQDAGHTAIGFQVGPKHAAPHMDGIVGKTGQHGLQGLCVASDLAEGLLNNPERPPVRDARGQVLREGQAIVHFNEVDEGAGLDALITNRVWTDMGLDPATTLFVVASKTFGTIETLTNARTARAWLVDALGEDAVAAEHGDLDVIMLRNDPSTEPAARAWAQQAGILFTRVAMQRGVVVVNDPNGLAKAMNKMYFQLYPEQVRPRALITRDRDEIKAFVDKLAGLAGDGGLGEAIEAAEAMLAEARENPEVDFSEVRGQAHVKRALEIAAAGGHNILML